jgi:hypothetical protein
MSGKSITFVKDNVPESADLVFGLNQVVIACNMSPTVESYTCTCPFCLFAGNQNNCNHLTLNDKGGYLQEMFFYWLDRAKEHHSFDKDKLVIEYRKREDSPGSFAILNLNEVVPSKKKVESSPPVEPSVPVEPVIE